MTVIMTPPHHWERRAAVSRAACPRLLFRAGRHRVAGDQLGRLLASVAKARSLETSSCICTLSRERNLCAGLPVTENQVSSLGEMVPRLRGQSLTLGPRSRGSGNPTEELDLIMIRLPLREPSSRFLEPVHDTSPRVAKSGTGTAALMRARQNRRVRFSVRL